MIEYLRNSKNGTIIYKNNSTYEEKVSCLTYVKNLCLKHLFTYEGYKKSVNLKFNKRNLLPLVLSRELVLIPLKRTKDYDNVWFNLKAVKEITINQNTVIATFFSNKQLKLNISLAFYLKQTKLAGLIELEKSKHFH